jgi:hypothetical protein
MLDISIVKVHLFQSFFEESNQLLPIQVKAPIKTKIVGIGITQISLREFITKNRGEVSVDKAGKCPLRV